MGIISPFNQTCKAFGLRGLFCPKRRLRVDPYFQLLAFRFKYSLTILGQHLAKHPWWYKQLFSSSNIFIIIIFHFLLYVAKVLSSLIDRERRLIRIEFLTLQGRPNTHIWGAMSPTQHFPFLSGLWIKLTPLDYRVRLLCTRMLRSSWTSSKRG